MNIKTIIRNSKLFCIYFFWITATLVVVAKEFSVNDLNVLLSDQVLYSNVSLREKPEYQALRVCLDSYSRKPAPVGFDEQALKLIISFDVRRAILVDKIEYYRLEDRGYLFSSLLSANQSFSEDTKPYLEVARCLGGIERIKKDEYDCKEQKNMRSQDHLVAINESISNYRQCLIRACARRLPDIRECLQAEQFDSFTNEFARVGKLNRLEKIVLKRDLVSSEEYEKLLNEFWRKENSILES